MTIKQELEQYELTDCVVDFSIMCQKFGVRAVLAALKECDSAMYDEMKVQINRGEQVPALFKRAG
jgi:hypothetical protein